MNGAPRPLPAAADLYGDLLDVEAPARRQPLSAYLPGLAITGVASLAAAWLSEHYHAPLMLMGLLIGLAFNFVNGDSRLHPGLGFASRTLLRWGIVLVGAQVTLWQIAALGWAGFAAIAAMIVLVTAAGALAARLLGLGAAFGTLAGGAVGICGASAALALATVLGEKRVNQAQLTLVLVAVSAASALAMSLYPALAALAGLDDHAAGFLIGASIHDVAQALGAGYSISDSAGQTAAIIKLTRVAMLAPVLVVVAMLFRGEGGRVSAGVAVPWFVVGFLLLAVANSFVTFPAATATLAHQGTSVLLLMAVVATGIRSPMQLLLAQGWRGSAPVIAATLVSLALAMTVALLLL
ncbi:YeiH family protein [Sphingomonas flavalba]|uniref:YeiH family protein n=1 Tax=Sphingomonas flavalba TaxID=2559804 RepID=UPI0039E18CAC